MGWEAEDESERWCCRPGAVGRLSSACRSDGLSAGSRQGASGCERQPALLDVRGWLSHAGRPAQAGKGWTPLPRLEGPDLAVGGGAPAPLLPCERLRLTLRAHVACAAQRAGCPGVSVSVVLTSGLLPQASGPALSCRGLLLPACRYIGMGLQLCTSLPIAVVQAALRKEASRGERCWLAMLPCRTAPTKGHVLAACAVLWLNDERTEWALEKEQQ